MHCQVNHDSGGECRTSDKRDIATRQPPDAIQSFHSLYMTSNKRDALHPDNLPRSFVRPVWWQNPTAEMQQGLREALQELAAEEKRAGRIGRRESPKLSKGSRYSNGSPGNRVMEAKLPDSGGRGTGEIRGGEQPSTGT
jgi:hypothetical protein